MSYGARSPVAIGFQDSWDNPVTDVRSFHFLPITQENIGQNTAQLISKNMRGTFAQGEYYEGKKNISGTFSTEAQPILIGHILQAAFGVSSSVSAGDAYQHVFLPYESDHDAKSPVPAITYYKYMDEPGSASLLYNAVVSTLEFKISNGEFLNVKATTMGGNHQQQEAFDTSSWSYSTGKRWTWDVASMTLTSSANTDVEDLTLTFESNFEEVHTHNGSKWPAKVKRAGFRTLKVAGTLCFEDQLEYQKFLAATEQNFALSFRGNEEISSGYYNTLTIQSPKLRWTEFKPIISGSGRHKVSVKGVLNYDTDSGTDVLITLVNTLFGYGGGEPEDPVQSGKNFWRIVPHWSAVHQIRLNAFHLLETPEDDVSVTNSGAILTASVAPDSGTLADLLDEDVSGDDVLWSTWSDLYVTFEYPVKRAMRFIRIARNDSSGAFFRNFEVQYSDNGTDFTTYRVWSDASIVTHSTLGVTNSYAPLMHFGTDFAGAGTSTHWRVLYPIAGHTSFISNLFIGELELYEADETGTNTSDVSTVVTGTTPSQGIALVYDGVVTNDAEWSIANWYDPASWYLEYRFSSAKAITKARWGCDNGTFRFVRGFSLYYLDASSVWQLQWNQPPFEPYPGNETLTDFIDVTTHKGLP